MFKVGKACITKLFDLELNGFSATQLLPDLSEQTLYDHPGWLDPYIYERSSGKVPLSVHSWLVQHNGVNILIDTGAGNDKPRPSLEVLDHLQTPYLDRLRDAGVTPDQIDYILLTHIHADHVGWNTRWDGTAWVPTFPNATTICSDLEWRYSAALAANDDALAHTLGQSVGLGDPARTPTPGVFADSMAPLETSGRLRRVNVDTTEILEGIRLLPTAGHSIDHAAISITSDGEEAIFGGDVLHHPFELYQPDLVSMFCEFPAAARQARLKLLSRVVEHNALYFSSHFPHTSAGTIKQDGEAFSWQFKNE